MTAWQIDDVLDEMAGLDTDDQHYRDILEHAGSMLLRRPAIGAQLVGRICAADDDDPECEALAGLLVSGLQTAALARESGKKQGAAFLQEVEDAVAFAARNGSMKLVHRLVFSRIWGEVGLPAPRSLQMSPDEMDRLEDEDLPQSGIEAQGMLDNLFSGLMRETGGDAAAIHAAISEQFPAMPDELPAHIVQTMVTRPEATAPQLACFWLLDPAPEIRLAAAEGLSTRHKQTGLSVDIVTTLTQLRSWIPEDETRRVVDQIIRDNLRSVTGHAASPATSHWVIQNVYATLPDGGGAQSIAIALQSGKQRKTAMLLLKQGYGVKDAFIMPAASASEQKALLQELEDQGDGVKVSPEWVRYVLSGALSDGLMLQNLPPAAGLIEIARICGFDDLRPEKITAEGLIAGLDPTARIKSLSASARNKRIKGSANWLASHQILTSWFESNDESDAVLEADETERTLENDLWIWLETRREHWAVLIARAASVLGAAKHPDADSFTAVAMALIDGHDLKRIPIMRDIIQQTIDAWAFGDMDDDDLMDAIDPGDLATTYDPPEPEKRGELARMLKHSDISADWIDGFLVAVVIAPKPVGPDQWLGKVLEHVLTMLHPDHLQRFVDLTVMRCENVLTQLESPKGFVQTLTKRSGQARKDWATGFTSARDNFPATWKDKTVKKDDRENLKIISDATTGGLSGSDLTQIGIWVVGRAEQTG